jgi:hypothetical protein
VTDTPFFNIPLDLPHAGRLSDRLIQMLEKVADRDDARFDELFERAERLGSLLYKYMADDENPNPAEAKEVIAEAAELLRGIVGDVEKLGVGYDRMGQVVRNIFECLELGREGAQLSLRAGEDPNSLQRPY